ncbi:class I SAM-dependent methyltransferase [Aquimarina sp. D1M17]|uniref:class I SAM-dependent methyltransferase n=1 Tax=Aquimarina acroporae TaxID=2937283 RepID=UPI0020BFA0B1|nr:class I SAM-dependent methyltransferase [Aquimarina acroporae]MCK8521616.1 class I SAM-dependent methyltransferase [Aquimarina acroporae]
MYEGTFPHKRYKKTLEFLRQHVPAPANILDLGVRNPFVEFMEKEGYIVSNTKGEDLDLHIDAVKATKVDIVTAFEIFEHLIAPFNVLKEINADKLVASIPMRLWFSKAYRSKTDPWDRHYHEFEDWQFDWLLEKAGWKIVAREKWTHPVKKLGFRPLLRLFTPRYYIVYAERNAS